MKNLILFTVLLLLFSCKQHVEEYNKNLNLNDTVKVKDTVELRLTENGLIKIKENPLIRYYKAKSYDDQSTIIINDSFYILSNDPWTVGDKVRVDSDGDIINGSDTTGTRIYEIIEKINPGNQ